MVYTGSEICEILKIKTVHSKKNVDYQFEFPRQYKHYPRPKRLCIFDNIREHSVCVKKAQLIFPNMRTRSETVWYAFILALRSKINLDSLNHWLSEKRKLCFGSFFLNADKFNVYFSIFRSPSDHNAYSLGFQQNPAKNHSWNTR